jgi:hypothetical protein
MGCVGRPWPWGMRRDFNLYYGRVQRRMPLRFQCSVPIQSGWFAEDWRNNVYETQDGGNQLTEEISWKSATRFVHGNTCFVQVFLSIDNSAHKYIWRMEAHASSVGIAAAWLHSEPIIDHPNGFTTSWGLAVITTPVICFGLPVTSAGIVPMGYH